MLVSQDHDFTFFVTIQFKFTTFMIVLMQDFLVQFSNERSNLVNGTRKNPIKLISKQKPIIM
jgi:hypothetical protein